MPTSDETLRARARTMRREPTLAEKHLWTLLRDRRLGGLKFRRQVPLGRYIADFACFDPPMIVEADGGAHQDPAYDAERDAWLEAKGYRVLRFGNETVIARPHLVFAAILAVEGPASR
jgi:very-short-patch-repair endonuclease